MLKLIEPYPTSKSILVKATTIHHSRLLIYSLPKWWNDVANCSEKFVLLLLLRMQNTQNMVLKVTWERRGDHDMNSRGSQLIHMEIWVPFWLIILQTIRCYMKRNKRVLRNAALQIKYKQTHKVAWCWCINFSKATPEYPLKINPMRRNLSSFSFFLRICSPDAAGDDGQP